MLFPNLLGSKNAQKKLSIKRFARVLNRKTSLPRHAFGCKRFLIERKAVEKAGRSEAPTRVDGKKKEYTALSLNSCTTGLSYTDHNVDHVDSSAAHAY